MRAVSTFKLKLSLPQGADHRQHLTWKAGTPPVPVDLTGCSARMQVRAKIDAPEVLDELSTGNGRIVLGGADGAIELVFPHAVSAAYAWRSGVYDLELTMSDGTVRRLLQGQVAVDPEVTRD